MTLTLEDVRISAGGTAVAPAQDANETLVVEGPDEPIRVHIGHPERDAVSTVRIGDLRHPRLRLIAPLDLVVTRHEDGVSVFDERTGLWGEGDHFTAAIEDFQATLAELYTELQESRDQLGPGMEAEWAALQELVEERL
jgi:hypothetical protein